MSEYDIERPPPVPPRPKLLDASTLYSSTSTSSHDSDYHALCPASPASGAVYDPYNEPSPTLKQPPHPHYMPGHLPYDMYRHSTQWVPSSPCSYIAHPSHWSPVSATGPRPFITRLVYRLPETSVEVWWESRKHRKEVEMYVNYKDSDNSYIKQLQQQRRRWTLPWYRRVLKVHINRISWWSVLCWNVGSHALIYAGICFYIPFFNKSQFLYYTNTGWTSVVLAMSFWIIAALLELVAIFTTRPFPKMYQHPRGVMYGILKRPARRRQRSKASASEASRRRTQDEHEHDTQHNRHASISTNGSGRIHSTNTTSDEPPVPQLSHGNLLHRLDFLIAITRLVGVVSWFVSSVVFSGTFDLTDTQHYAGNVLPELFGSVLLCISGYLSIIEITHSWSLFKAPISRSFRSLEWYCTVFFTLATLCFICYGVLLIFWQDVLLQRDAPAYPFIVASVLFTASDWCQLIEQGDQINVMAWERIKQRQQQSKDIIVNSKSGNGSSEGDKFTQQYHSEPINGTRSSVLALATVIDVHDQPVPQHHTDDADSLDQRTVPV